MNLVFMNNLERKTEDNQVVTAQVIILEGDGVWKVTWQQTNERGKSEKECWFEGKSWDEMLKVFRKNLAEKLAKGYVPILKEIFESEE